MFRDRLLLVLIEWLKFGKKFSFFSVENYRIEFGLILAFGEVGGYWKVES